MPAQRRRGIHRRTKTRFHLHVPNAGQVNLGRGMVHGGQRFSDGGQRLAAGIALGRILHPFEKRIHQVLEPAPRLPGVPTVSAAAAAT